VEVVDVDGVAVVVGTDVVGSVVDGGIVGIVVTVTVTGTVVVVVEVIVTVVPVLVAVVMVSVVVGLTLDAEPPSFAEPAVTWASPTPATAAKARPTADATRALERLVTRGNRLGIVGIPSSRTSAYG
jgi:hypothetical protein